MGPPPEHYDLAATGVADIAYVQTSYTPGRFPMAEIADLPISNFTQEQLSKAFAELYKKGYFDRDFSDTHVLCFCGIGPYQLHMRKGEAVKRYADIKNKKLRASGAIATQVIKAMGAVPVGMPGPEVFTALQKGVVDGAYIPWDFIKAFRTEAVVESLTEINFGGSMHLLVMNSNVYNKMPADLRAIIDEVSSKYSPIFGAVHDKLVAEAKELLKGKGGVTYQLPASDVERIRTVMATIWENWVGGDTTKKRMVADFAEILEGFGVVDPILGYTP
jgi:TRAP-type C4-dicarboxylate transport system substrate-binding protein